MSEHSGSAFCSATCHCLFSLFGSLLCLPFEVCLGVGGFSILTVKRHLLNDFVCLAAVLLTTSVDYYLLYNLGLRKHQTSNRSKI